MKQTITLSMFRDAFIHMNRKENFSYEGLEVLFEYLEEANPDYDLDVIELCCEYSEWDIEEVCDEYNVSGPQELEENTLMLPIGKGQRVIIQNY